MINPDLEAFISRVSPVGDPVEIPLALLINSATPPPFEDTDEDEDASALAVVELMALPAFADQWHMLHDMIGGMVSMRTSAPCPLGDQARSEGGRVACEAAYQLILSSPALSRMILSPQSSLMGQVMAVGVHGFSCIQIVKMSQQGATHPTYEETENGD